MEIEKVQELKEKLGDLASFDDESVTLGITYVNDGKNERISYADLRDAVAELLNRKLKERDGVCWNCALKGTDKCRESRRVKNARSKAAMRIDYCCDYVEQLG